MQMRESLSVKHLFDLVTICYQDNYILISKPGLKSGKSNIKNHEDINKDGDFQYDLQWKK